MKRSLSMYSQRSQALYVLGEGGLLNEFLSKNDMHESRADRKGESWAWPRLISLDMKQVLDKESVASFLLGEYEPGCRRS